MIGPLQTFLQHSLDTPLKLCKVMQFGEVVTVFIDTWTEIPDREEQTGFLHDTVVSADFRKDSDYVLRGNNRRRR